MNLMKKALSSGVNLFPEPADTTRDGGEGDREGRSGTLTSAWGAGRRSLNTGSKALRLLRVVRPLPVTGTGATSAECV